MERIKSLLVATLLILLITSFANIVEAAGLGENEKYRFLIYGNEDCDECRRLEKFLVQEIDNNSISLLSLDDGNNSAGFLNIIHVLVNSSIPVQFPFCYECMSKEEIGSSMNLLIPLTAIFRNGDLKAIVTGFYSEAFWSRVLDKVSSENLTYFFAPGTEAVIQDGTKKEIEEILSPYQDKERRLNVYEIFPLTLGLAIADSVNPCTFSIFTAILLISLHAFGRRKAILRGLSFLAAIYLSYYLLGLGLLHALPAIPNIKQIVALIGLPIALDSIMRGLRKNFKSPIPGSVKRRIQSLIEKPLSPFMAFAAGVIIGICVLPCSGGPYIVGLGFLSLLKEPGYAYLLLAFYNLIFVMPMLLILAAFYVFSDSARKIKALRSTRYNILELISGILLVTICIYAFVTS